MSIDYAAKCKRIRKDGPTPCYCCKGECVGPLIDDTNEKHEAQSGTSRLWGWFGLSYAAWCVLPRVLMCAMPDDWQKRMAILLEEYSDAYPNHPDTDCLVLSRKGQRFLKWPGWLTNYRHPNETEIENARVNVMMVDPLLDRTCVLLDGACDCARPVTENCRHTRKLS